MGNSDFSFGWGIQTYGDWQKHVSAMRIVTNSCNCPASYFMTADISPTAMSMQVVNGVPATQAIGYVRNWIDFIYEQDCGTYTVKFEPVDPTCDLTSALSADARSGAGGANNKPYSQQITMNTADVNMIGQCQTNLVIEQDVTDASDSFLDGTSAVRRMPSIKVPF
jgi:hypothetical protein